jgi:hypothetical protein
VDRDLWIVMRDDAVVGWTGLVPLPAEPAAATSAAVGLAEAVLAVGGETDVLRLGTVADDGTDLRPLDYAEHLRAAAACNSVVPFFTLAVEEWPAGRRLRTSGRIACHDEAGEVVEREVDDLGALLAASHPEATEADRPFMGHAPPLEVLGAAIDLRRPGGQEARLCVESRSDLWFPRVLGVLDGDVPSPPAGPARDNSALAAIHTPRLNRFVRVVRDLVESRGGTWRIAEPEGIARRYAARVTQDGISLD